MYIVKKGESMKISEKIVVLRKRKGMSQEDLANELDVSRQAVYKWENGGTTPDINKIKKMAELFDLSYNELLDDNIDITKVVSPLHTQAAVKTYRKVFNSQTSLDYEQPNLDSGYTESRKNELVTASQILLDKIKKMKADLEKLGIKNYVILHDAMAGCLFIDDANKYFGFYYGGYIQFLCPFENLLNFSISNSGLEMGYKNKPILGVGFGLDGINSIGAGSYSIPTLQKPLKYGLIISYCDSDGRTCEFKIELFAYITQKDCYEIKKKDEIELRVNLRSSFIGERMNEIANKLETCKIIGNKILNKELDAPELDLDKIKTDYLANIQKEKAFVESMENQAISFNKEQNKKRWIAVIAVAAALLVIILISMLI